MTWQGLGDIINRWRKTRLGLEPVQLTWAPGMLARLRVPFTYCWYGELAVNGHNHFPLTSLQVTDFDPKTRRLALSHIDFRFLLPPSRQNIHTSE